MWFRKCGLMAESKILATSSVALKVRMTIKVGLALTSSDSKASNTSDTMNNGWSTICRKQIVIVVLWPRDRHPSDVHAP